MEKEFYNIDPDNDRRIGKIAQDCASSVREYVTDEQYRELVRQIRGAMESVFEHDSLAFLANEENAS